MPPDLASIWPALSSVLALVVLISQVISEFGYGRHTKPAPNHSLAVQTRTVNLQKVQQREPSNRPPVFLSLMSLICAFLLLGFGIWATSTWIAGIAELQMGLWVVPFLVLFIALPIYVIVDHFHIQPKYYKLGKSSVAKEARIVVSNDADAVFDACYLVLGSMQAAIRIMERPSLLTARIGNSAMTITIVQTEGSETIVYVVSDSRWLTVKWDRGANQRKIDSFVEGLGKQ